MRVIRRMISHGGNAGSLGLSGQRTRNSGAKSISCEAPARRPADGSDVARLEVPPATLRLLSQILALMARQQTFVLYPESSELTTKQAAELLGVSRPRGNEVREVPYAPPIKRQSSRALSQDACLAVLSKIHQTSRAFELAVITVAASVCKYSVLYAE